jgi:phage tail-like protein
VSTSVAMELIDADQQATFQLLGYDFAYAGDPDQCSGSTLSDVLYVTAADGEQTFAFQLTRNGDQIGLEPLPQYFPMRLFGGRGVIASGGRVFYDSRDRWVSLVAQRRPRYSTDAVVETRAFDGKEPDCVWHRLLLDACIPPETAVQVWSRASNQQNRLDFLDWQAEPRLYLRGNGSEQPFVPQVRGVDSGTWELLFQRATGRYLQLRLVIAGGGRNTPRLRALRSYYPRFSYLKNYMPAVYREDPVSASFLDRFLSNIEGFFTNIEDRIALAEVLFEVRNAPPDVLAWLANWFGVALDPAWDEATQRLFLRHAMDFFQFRGTIPGLTMALRLVLEGCPDEGIFDLNSKPRPGGVRLVEKFRTRRTPGVLLGDPGLQSGLPLTPQTARWLPSQNAAELHRRYAVALGSSSPRLYPVNPPADAAELAVWKQFSQVTLGFLPRVSQSEAPLWTDFLTRRYQQIAALNSAWQSAFRSFDEIQLPAQLPSNQGPLRDWFQFQGVVLPTRDNAHRFSVLLPVPLAEAFDSAAHQRRMELAKRVIDLEKPAHTAYDMKFYWALCRVGEVRLGEDSVLDFGSRAPSLLPPMVLGNAYVASSYLAPGFPQDLNDRQRLGQQVLSRRNTDSTDPTGATS